MKDTELLAKIESLEARVAALEAANQIVSAFSGQNENVNWSRKMASMITPELAEKLGIASVGSFSTTKPWFRIVLQDGRTVSVKRTEFALRIRVRRDEEQIGGDIKMAINAFPAGLSKVVAELV